MTILADSEIRELCQGDRPMITPFYPDQIKLSEAGDRLISYGCSSHGYDMLLAPEFKIFTNINSTIIDPKNFNPAAFVDVVSDHVIIPPHSFILARSIEYFKMPKDVCAIVLAKSTYARCGNSCLATPLECGWEGHLTLEFANNTPLPSKMYANEGCAQLLFFRSEVVPDVSYFTRSGKYQLQKGITLPKV